MKKKGRRVFCYAFQERGKKGESRKEAERKLSTGERYEREDRVREREREREDVQRIPSFPFQMITKERA
jgi:hypothetical protein